MPEFQRVVLGTPADHVQEDARKISSVRGGDCWIVRIFGTRAEVLAREARVRPGVTTYPQAAADVFGDADVRLDSTELSGAEGGMAELVLRYVRRNAKEGDVSPSGLLS